jgi:hypothetical protein
LQKRLALRRLGRYSAVVESERAEHSLICGLIPVYQYRGIAVPGTSSRSGGLRGGSAIISFSGICIALAGAYGAGRSVPALLRKSAEQAQRDPHPHLSSRLRLGKFSSGAKFHNEVL